VLTSRLNGAAAFAHFFFGVPRSALYDRHAKRIQGRDRMSIVEVFG
jgi:hypothetical protein